MMASLPMAELAGSAIDIWIWPEGEGVRWWCAGQTRLLPIERPGAIHEAPAIGLLRDQHARWGLETTLAPGFGDLLTAALRCHSRVRLQLHRGLPPQWHGFPFEWLHHEGQPLHGRLSVGRDRNPEEPPSAAIDPQREIVVLNLLPRTEPIQPAWAIPPGLAQMIDGSAAAELFLARADLPSLAALCVLAHGSEDPAAPPFRLPDGSLWALPTGRGLPPLVMLLACGDDDGNLIDEARRLMAAGADAVIAPQGRPTLEGAGHFLRGFLLRWYAGERLDDTLCALAAEVEGTGGAQRLILVGRGDLHLADVATIDEWDDERLADAVADDNAEALKTLVDRLTRRGAQAGHDIDEAESALRRLLAIPPKDQPGEQRLLVALESIERDLQPLTRAWVLPLLAHLAEAYAHDLIARFETERLALDQSGVPVSAPILHSWSKLYYRQGRYALALRDLAHGLTLVAPANPYARGAGVLRHLAGLLIDVDLPWEAQVLANALDDGLASRADAQARRDRHLLKDSLARITMRLGQPLAALTHYRCKRAEAPEFGGDGQRELAWLLYIAAWLPPGEPGADGEYRDWAAQACSYLDHYRSQVVHLGYGNFDPIYLLRACAAWGWRRGDRGALDLVLDYRDLLRERIFAADKADPGPPGLCLSFLHLAHADGFLNNPPIPPWDAIRVALEGSRYFIELASLAHLLGRPKEAAEYLGRFQVQRQLSPGVSFPSWLHGGLLTDWCGICARRAEYEQEVLAYDGPPDIARLVESGLLPL